MISLARYSAFVILTSAIWSVLVAASGMRRSDGQANLNQFTAADCAPDSVYPPLNGDSGFFLSDKGKPDQCGTLKKNGTAMVDMVGMYWGNSSNEHYVARQLTFYTDENCITVAQWFVDAGSGNGKNIGDETPCFNQSDFGGPWGSVMIHRSANADNASMVIVGPGEKTS